VVKVESAFVAKDWSIVGTRDVSARSQGLIPAAARS
jgi:hypothetical protein